MQAFNFEVPIDHIEKGTQEGTGREIYKIRGVASTNHRDLDGHVLEPAGFDSSYLLENGHFNFNHQSKTNPAANIGEPTLAEMRVGKDGTPEYWVEGFLYADHPLAQQCVDHMTTLKKNKSKRRMRFSIEGKPVEVNPNDKTHFTRTLITGIALTPTPKNAATWAELCKGLSSGAGLLPAHPDDAPSTTGRLVARIFDQLPEATPGQVRRISQLAAHLATQSPTPMQDNTATLDESLDKAFAMLGLEKGTVPPPNTSDNDDDDDDDDNADDDNADDDDDALQKAQMTAADMVAKGCKAGEILKALKAEGHDEDTAADAYSLAKHAAKSSGAKPAKPAPAAQESLKKSITQKRAELAELEKSLDNELAAGRRHPLAAELLPQHNEQLEDLQKGLDEKFGSLGLVLTEVLSQLEGNNQRFEQMQNGLNRLESESGQPRTLLTKGFAEREFQQPAAAAPAGKTMSATRDRGAILDLIEAKANYQDPNDRYLKNLLGFENTGQLEKSVLDELQREGGFTLVA